MLKVTIRYNGNIYEERSRFYTALAENNVNIIKCTHKKAVIYISDQDVLNDLLYKLNCETHYGVYASKIKDLTEKASASEVIVLTAFIVCSTVGLGTIINYIAEVITQWLV